MRFNTYQEALKFINTSNGFSFDESYDLSKLCSVLLKDYSQENKARDLLIRVLDKFDFIHEKTKQIWFDLIAASGLYPYLLDDESLSLSNALRLEYHRSKYLPGYFFHEEQNELSIELGSGKSVVLSAPTSFGKSLLIEEIIARKKFNNIVIVQPTLALLDETRKKMSKYRDDYKIIVSTMQMPSENKKNIFLFTGERVVEYKHFSSVDFFVIDEFYKLSLGREDDRAIVLNHALYKLLKFTKSFYLLGPMVKSIPLEFKNKFRPIWYNTSFSTVAINEYTLANTKFKNNPEIKKEELYNLLIRLEEPTLIYCSSPEKATKLAIGFQAFIEEKIYKVKNQEIFDMQEWIKENINDKWSLNDALYYRIGIHHGALPRHLGSSIVDFFNKGLINYLFCTATLIEGVNTSTKNVILYDKRKGLKELDFFDYRNIAGRSGRMSRYFVGNIYKFENEPPQIELDIDIPIITQKDAPIELIVQIDENDLTESSKKRVSHFNELEDTLQEIVKTNSGLSVSGQLKIVEKIQDNLSFYSSSITWHGYPRYNQLLPVIELIWEHLIDTKENKAGIRTAKHLATLTIQYSIYKSIKALIDLMIGSEYWIRRIPEDQERINFSTFFILNVSRHWFDYKLPKLLSAISVLQEYAFLNKNVNPGEYTFLANQIENSFLPDNLTMLKEYDIPYSAIRKIGSDIKTKLTIDELQQRFTNENFRRWKLNNYEIRKIKKSLIL